LPRTGRPGAFAALHLYRITDIEIAGGKAAAHPDAFGGYFDQDDLHVPRRHAERFEISDDRLIERAPGRRGPAANRVISMCV